jgi:hypothetical protein
VELSKSWHASCKQENQTSVCALRADNQPVRVLPERELTGNKSKGMTGATGKIEEMRH